MSVTFNEISTKLASKNPIVIMRKNINISNYYYIEDNFDKLNSYSLYICKLSNFPKEFKTDKIINFSVTFSEVQHIYIFREIFLYIVISMFKLSISPEII